MVAVVSGIEPLARKDQIQLQKRTRWMNTESHSRWPGLFFFSKNKNLKSCIHPRWCCCPHRWGAHGEGESFGRGTKPGTEDPAPIGSGHLARQARPHGSRCRDASFFCGACMDRNAPRPRFWSQNTFCVLCGESAQRGYLRQWSRWALHAWSCAAVRPVNIFTPNLIEYSQIYDYTI